MANNVTEWLVETTKRAGGTQPGLGGRLVREAQAQGKFQTKQFNLQHLAVACFGPAWESSGSDCQLIRFSSNQHRPHLKPNAVAWSGKCHLC